MATNNLKLICFLLFFCSFCRTTIPPKYGLTVSNQDKKKAYTTHLNNIEIDSVLVIYKSVDFDVDFLPSRFIQKDSMVKLTNYVKSQVESDIIYFISNNTDFLNDYFKIANPFMSTDLENINMCHLMQSYDSKYWPYYWRTKLKPLIEKLDFILQDSKNRIVEFYISTAPPSVMAEEVVIVQRGLSDNSESCFLAHTGYLRTGNRLNIASDGYFQSDPQLKNCIGYFESKRRLVVNIPILDKDLYIADLTCVLIK